jgi:hypothetical protein
VAGLLLARFATRVPQRIFATDGRDFGRHDNLDPWLARSRNVVTTDHPTDAGMHHASDR